MTISHVSSADVLRYTEADVITCSENQPRDADERQALRRVVLKYAYTKRTFLGSYSPSLVYSKPFLFFKSGDTASRLSPEQTKPAISGES